MKYLLLINLKLFEVFNFFDQPKIILGYTNFSLQIVFQVHIECHIQAWVIRWIVYDSDNLVQIEVAMPQSYQNTN